MTKLYTNVNNFKKHILHETKQQLQIFRFIFYFLNILIFIATLATTIIASLILSKLIFKSYPYWFLVVSTGLTACSTLFSSLINFFYIKDRIVLLKNRIHTMNAELIKYNNQLSEKYKTKDKDYYLFTSLAADYGNIAAKKEVGLE